MPPETVPWNFLKHWILQKELYEQEHGRPAPLNPQERHALNALVPGICVAPPPPPGGQAASPSTPATVRQRDRPVSQPSPFTADVPDGQGGAMRIPVKLQEMDATGPDYVSALTTARSQTQVFRLDHRFFEVKMGPFQKWGCIYILIDRQKIIPSLDCGLIDGCMPCFASKKEAKQYAAHQALLFLDRGNAANLRRGSMPPSQPITAPAPAPVPVPTSTPTPTPPNPTSFAPDPSAAALHEPPTADSGLVSHPVQLAGPSGLSVQVPLLGTVSSLDPTLVGDQGGDEAADSESVSDHSYDLDHSSDSEPTDEPCAKWKGRHLAEQETPLPEAPESISNEDQIKEICGRLGLPNPQFSLVEVCCVSPFCNVRVNFGEGPHLIPPGLGNMNKVLMEHALDRSVEQVLEWLVKQENSTRRVPVRP
ncbi:unnamed protein product [Parascedosporium putredinis]|uniref:DRBM domain-containing protein n=1 Tax=Parascedosporium putredinis TaxID=1442378 RepID=A0A9P1M687_9PEZI|nr:unnamed protein product [Parascedosporium putredinis]CAI7989264.1 unnamed protein product [Parascedosporium putredinis]